MAVSFARAYAFMLPGLVVTVLLVNGVETTVQQPFVVLVFSAWVLAGAARGLELHDAGVVGLALERGFNHIRVTLSFVLALLVGAAAAAAIAAVAALALPGTEPLLWLPAFVVVTYPFLRRAWPVMVLSFVVPESAGRRGIWKMLWSGPGLGAAWGLTAPDSSAGAARPAWSVLVALHAAVVPLAVLTNLPTPSAWYVPIAGLFFFLLYPLALWIATRECAQLWRATPAGETADRRAAAASARAAATAGTDDDDEDELWDAGRQTPETAFLDAAHSKDPRGELGATALALALRNANVTVVEALLRQGADVSLPDDLGVEPLHYIGIDAANVRFLRALLDRGARVDVRDQRGATPLIYAARRQCLEGLTALLDAGAAAAAADDQGRTALHYAAEGVRHGVGAEAIVATIGRLLEADSGLRERADRHGDRPLHVAAHWGNLPALACLLDASAAAGATNRDGLTPLQVAARGHHREAADRLLAVDGAMDIATAVHLNRGDVVRAQVDADPGLARYRLAPGDTPLINVAVRYADVEVVRLLLAHGAAEAEDVRGVPLWNTSCLVDAVYTRRDRRLVDLLLDHHASLEWGDGDGNTPLMWAVRHGDLEIARRLLEAGADPDLENERGGTPRMAAQRDPALAALVESYRKR